MKRKVAATDASVTALGMADYAQVFNSRTGAVVWEGPIEPDPGIPRVQLHKDGKPILSASLDGPALVDGDTVDLPSFTLTLP